MSYVAVATTEVDAKSPMDDALMEKIADDLADLDSRVITAGASPYVFDVQGRLQYVSTEKRSIAAAIVNEAFIPTRCRYVLKKGGTTGNMAFDLRKHTSPRNAIISVLSQYTGGTTSIANTGTALNTQSISRATAQINTQSISFAKASNAVQSIILLGTQPISEVDTDNLVQYNLANAIDSDTVVGDSVVFASCTTGANNGTFTIVEINREGNPSIVVVNASGVAQTGVAGTAQIPIMSYNYTNPVNALFTAGLSHKFTTHTTGANNGTFLVYAINQAGNNIWVKNSAGVVQAGVAGTADTCIFIFALSVAASTTDYIIGEAAHTAAHTSGLNDAGALTITAVNSGGNNLYLYNSVGVTQGGVAGTIKTNRWTYAMPTDPSAQVSAGYGVYLTLHTNALNNGYFVAKEVNRSGANNVVIYNTSGVAQASTPGTLATTRKVVSFAADQSANYTTLSFVELRGCVDSLYNHYFIYSPFQVVQVNRGGGANYNIVIETGSGATAAAAEQVSPAGYVQTEMKSIFSASPSLAVDLTGLEPNRNIGGTSLLLLTDSITAGTPIALYITEVMGGDPTDFTVILR